MGVRAPGVLPVTTAIYVAVEESMYEVILILMLLPCLEVDQ